MTKNVGKPKGQFDHYQTFELEDGTSVTVNGADTIEYDGEQHNAANLFDALKESMYGDM